MATSRQLEVVSATAVLAIISSAVLALRIYARAKIVKIVGIDDWLMVAAHVSWPAGDNLTSGTEICGVKIWVLINEATALTQVWFACGKHDKDITPSGYDVALKATYSWHITHITAICLIKLSVLSFFLRLSVEQSHRIVVYVVGVITIIGTVTLLGTNIFQCSPISNAWNSSTYPAGCINIKLNMSAASFFHIVTDVTIYLMPVPVIARLHASARRGLLSIFIVGAIPVAASIARFVSLATLDWSKDIPYQGARVLTWTAFELNVAIIAACMPALKTIFFRSKFGGSTNKNPIGEITIPLSLYPSDAGPGPSVDASVPYPYQAELVKLEPNCTTSCPVVRVSGIVLGQPSESQECIVQDGSEYLDKRRNTSQV